MADVDLGPDNPSSDHKQMAGYWTMIEAINGGAAGMRLAGEIYLPRFPNESSADYAHRGGASPFTNIYGDVSRNLASKPFAKELKLKEGANQSLVDLCEDIDGQGNNLHVFGATIFQYGLDKAIDWILVDYTRAPVDPSKPRSRAEEKQAGFRPYWVHVSAERLVAVYSDVINGVEQIVHARIREDGVDRINWKEETKSRVRVFDRPKRDDGTYSPATYEVFEKSVGAGVERWDSIEGPFPVTIGVIPLVPFITGKRLGSTWQVRPPLRDIAFLQIEEFQQESNLKSIMELTCYPMLVGNGVTGTDSKGEALRVPVGPRGVLFAPPNGDGNHGEWAFIEPNAASITALMAHLDATQKNMRDLGMQPLTQANLTVITSAHISLKANSAVQAWALALKDALEQAFKITAMWLGSNVADPEVEIFTDFGIELGDDKDVENVLKAQAQGVLSKQTALEEMQRRGFVSENVDLNEEAKRVSADFAVGGPLAAIDPATGERMQPLTRPLLQK